LKTTKGMLKLLASPKRKKRGTPMKITEILNSDSKTRRYTGLSIKKFNVLVNKIALLKKKAESVGKTKKNKPGAGRPCRLSLARKVALVLVYYRCYYTQANLGDMFGIDQSNVSRIISQIEPFIEQAADPELSKTFEKIKKNQEHIKTLSRPDFIKEYHELQRVITDATETPIPRPGASNELRRLYYSGKTKQFTLKTQVSVTADKKFLDISATYPGSFHDKTIMDIEKTIAQFPKQTHQLLDLGYQGIVEEYPEHYVILPAKKLPNCELSELGKEHNKNIAKRRVYVENALALIKKYAICVQVYRGKKCKFNQIFRNVAALCNLMLAD
jgi:hypothetical protein